MLKNSSGMIVATPPTGISIRSFSRVLTPDLPARRKLLEHACPCRDELLVGMQGFEAKLESLHDPGIAFRSSNNSTVVPPSEPHLLVRLLWSSVCKATLLL